VPDARGPGCGAWAPRQAWQAAPDEPFTSVCPACGHRADIAAIGYRLTVTAPVQPPPPGREPDG
jgi:hypothetical protein